MCDTSAYSQESEAGNMEPSSLDGKPSDTSSMTNTAVESSSNESKMGFSTMHQCSRVTFETSLLTVTPRHIREWLTSLQEDRLVRGSVSQAKDLAKKILETWSRRCSTSLKLCDLPSFSSRMPHQKHFDATCWSIYYQGLPKWGMTRHGALYQRKTPSGLTAIREYRRCSMREKEHGFLPLPLPTLKASDATRGYIVPSKDGKRGKDLNQCFKFPTLTEHGNYNRKGLTATSGDGLVTAIKKYPTLTCQDAKNNGSKSQMRRNSLPLNAAVGGQLNPDWTDWFMGLPIGSSALKPMEMHKYRQYLRLHGGC